jgi:hypothetical protein
MEPGHQCTPKCFLPFLTHFPTSTLCSVGPLPTLVSLILVSELASGGSQPRESISNLTSYTCSEVLSPTGLGGRQWDCPLHSTDGETEAQRRAGICLVQITLKQKIKTGLSTFKSSAWRAPNLLGVGRVVSTTQPALLTGQADTGPTGPGTVKGKWAGGRKGWLLNTSITWQAWPHSVLAKPVLPGAGLRGSVNGTLTQQEREVGAVQGQEWPGLSEVRGSSGCLCPCSMKAVRIPRAEKGGGKARVMCPWTSGQEGSLPQGLYL